ncbi:dephospho-CoA kinase [Nocardia tengchongensis]|uniref:Dephospho-CoA kinase n=1 Tax=Nocardia tengchongensis TaxID=2055889 RepID=A0ABX8CZ53_9NOCA|nr:dephospho-CoA kinase [Nocardia tengchongensis]
MLRIGLTGGMGAGKSTVARILTERGAVLVDSDVIAREVVAPGSAGLAALAAAFGDDILAADGSLDRPALAAKAFASDEARATLNGITHPLVGKRTAELIAAAPADGIVVQDIPLLVENGLAPFMNLVVIVDAAEETRLRRLVEFRGIDEADARARIAAQATDAQRRAAADVLLDNNGASGLIDAEVHRLWDERLIPFERNLRTRTPAARPELPVAEANPEWFAQARRVIARLAVACGADAASIDHIGPTAVPGKPAADVLDIRITVAAGVTAEALRDRLADIGFPPVAADDPIAAEVRLGAGERLHANTDPGRAVNLIVGD